jgi:hypothetical protein
MFGIGDAVAASLKVLDKFVPDPAAKAQAEAELRTALMAWDAQQTKVNEVEATNTNLFVSGWRPALGWTCAFAFAFIYILGPIVAWIAMLTGSTIPLPKFDAESLISLTLGMLGLGGLRTFEKIKGVTK